MANHSLLILLYILFAMMHYLGLKLIKKGILFRMSNLVALGIAMILVAWSYIFHVILKLIVFARLTFFLIYIFLLVYNHQTFYKKRKSPLIILLLSTIVLWVYSFWLEFPPSEFAWDIEAGKPFNSTIAILQNISSFICFGWLGYSSCNAYRSMKNQDVQPWILQRMKLMSIASYTMMVIRVPDLFVIGIPEGDGESIESIIITVIRLLMIFIAIFIFFIAWEMPLRFKMYFNRKASSTASTISQPGAEISEEKMFSLLAEEEN